MGDWKPMPEGSKLCVTCSQPLKGNGPAAFSHYEGELPRFNCYECLPEYIKMMAVKKEENL